MWTLLSSLQAKVEAANKVGVFFVCLFVWSIAAECSDQFYKNILTLRQTNHVADFQLWEG